MRDVKLKVVNGCLWLRAVNFGCERIDHEMVNCRILIGLSNDVIMEYLFGCWLLSVKIDLLFSFSFELFHIKNLCSKLSKAVHSSVSLYSLWF